MKLRWYQEECVKSTFSFLNSTPIDRNPLIELPTGTGKSLIPAEMIKRAMAIFPRYRFIVATHVQELVSQNADKMLSIWPTAPVGISCAGLKRKETHMPIIFGSIGTMYKRAAEYGHRDLMFIDEAHLLSPDDDTMYREFINILRDKNPNMRFVGLSATAYRHGLGSLKNGGIFTDSCYNMCSVEGFNRFVDEGYLLPLVAPPTKNKLNVSDIKVRNGDFVQEQVEDEVERILISALQEVCEHGSYRQSWLIFAAGVSNSDHISEILNGWGIPTESVHSKKGAEHNNTAIRDFKRGKLRCLVNYGKLTTGFDHPAIDLIAMFRATDIANLHVQMMGRGTRPLYMPGYDLDSIEGRMQSIGASAKQNCLFLDFARNVGRLGPINDPILPRKKGEKKGDVPIRICESWSEKGFVLVDGHQHKGCDGYNYAGARVCAWCGNPFPPPSIKYSSEAYSDDPVRQTEPKIELFNVTKIVYTKHSKWQGASSIRVQYHCGLIMYNEYVNLESDNHKAARFAREWWRQRFIKPEGFNAPEHWRESSNEKTPETVDDALKYTQYLQQPKKIRVHVNKQYPEIIGYEF